MGVAFKMARIALADRGDLANEIIAKRIIELAKAGERNPHPLCERRPEGISRAAAVDTALITRPRTSNFDQGIGTAGGFLDRERHVIDRRAARRAALVAPVMGMTVNDGAHLESVDRFAQT